MQPSDFSENKAGNLFRGTRDYWAFVPKPLPPDISATWELTRLVSKAEAALAALSASVQNIPNPNLLIAPFVRREATMSSQIEGTQASLSDLFVYEASGIVPAQSPDVHEVENYVKALEYSLSRLKTLPLSLRLIREAHAILMKDVRGSYMTPGEFRRSQNWIGPAGCTLNNATFVPPPPDEMNDALSEFETFLHAKSGLPPLIRIALIHYQFEAIHPFLDGNGRIGRLLISLLLFIENLLEKPLFYLSVYFEKNRQEYYRRLLDISLHGKWIEWIEFFMRGVIEQSHDAINRTEKLLSLRNVYRQKAADISSSVVLQNLLDLLFETPVVTVAGVSKRFEITHRAASMNIGKLVNMGILTETTGKERYRAFAAKEIISLIKEE